MPLTLHISPSDQIDAIDCSDPELTPTRARTVMRMRTRILNGDYVVDADAVAEALIERLRPAGPVSALLARAV